MEAVMEWVKAQNSVVIMLTVAIVMLSILLLSQHTKAAAPLQVTQLWVYPLKSARGVPVESARVTEFGFENDRRWLVVNATSGAFQTQRQIPALATIVAEVLPDGDLQLTASKTQASVTVPVVASAGGKVVDVVVWGQTTQAVDQGAAAAEFLAKELGWTRYPLALVRMDDDLPRAQVAKWFNADLGDDKPEDASATVSFADGFPFLVANEASLQNLNANLADPLPMNRFRPNIVVASPSLKPWGEESFGELVSGPVSLLAVKRCQRCRVTTTNQVTGEQPPLKGAEPLVTLCTLPNSKQNKAYFGVNAVHRRSSVGETLRVGDMFDVASRASLGP